MSSNIRQFIQNCNICGRTKPWRELKRGLLRPLPLPDRIWKEISMDFVTDLPLSNGYRNLMVVTDCLSKDVILIPLPNLEVETVADAFLELVVAYHWLPDYIVSDRGSQFLSNFWTTLCGKMRIKQRLLTAYHPQTNGSTERMNAVVEAYLRVYINWTQTDWARWTSTAQIAIKGQIAISTGVSPFFLQHGCDVNPVQEDEGWTSKQHNQKIPRPDEAAVAMIEKFKEIFNYIQARMAEAQQAQELQANCHWQEAPILQVGDRVWLKYGKTLSNRRLSQKLDWKNALFKVTEVISAHNIRLNVPGQLHQVFYVDRLRLHPRNLLPGQDSDGSQPEALFEDKDGKPEYAVEDIIAEKTQRRGRGQQKLYMVKWVGYAQCT
jgi:transposase InsO family protein